MSRRANRFAEVFVLVVFALIIQCSFSFAGPPAHPVLISGTPPSIVTSEGYYSFTPTVQGTGGDSLTFDIINKPSWATFSTSSGTLSGTPSGTGTYDNIQILVNDGPIATSLEPFSITVASVTAVPVMDGIWLLMGTLTGFGVLVRRWKVQAIDSDEPKRHPLRFL